MSAAYRIERPPEAFSLTGGKQKRPRKEDAAYLKQIRELPCVICLMRPVEAAHIRSPSIQWGKSSTGISEKPSDRWTLPLCGFGSPNNHHAEQHTMNEMDFYRKYQVDPHVVALALWGAREDEEVMDAIIRMARKR